MCLRFSTRSNEKVKLAFNVDSCADRWMGANFVTCWKCVRKKMFLLGCHCGGDFLIRKLETCLRGSVFDAVTWRGASAIPRCLLVTPVTTPMCTSADDHATTVSRVCWAQAVCEPDSKTGRTHTEDCRPLFEDLLVLS